MMNDGMMTTRRLSRIFKIASLTFLIGLQVFYTQKVVGPFMKLVLNSLQDPDTNALKRNEVTTTHENLFTALSHNDDRVVIDEQGDDATEYYYYYDGEVDDDEVIDVLYDDDEVIDVLNDENTDDEKNDIEDLEDVAVKPETVQTANPTTSPSSNPTLSPSSIPTRKPSSSPTLKPTYSEEIFQPIRVSAEKLITPGNHHKEVPDPEKRLGPDGQGNYIHDPKFLINNPPEFNIPLEEAEDVCLPLGQGFETNSSITSIQKIRNHIETSKASRDVKLFCAVYTYSEQVNTTQAIGETWGKRCDGMLYASDHSNLTNGHMHMPGITRYEFRYGSMYQRIRAMKAYIYDEFLDDYDFFHFSGDDVYILVENLKEFLASEKVREWDESPGKVTIAGSWTHWRGFGKNYPEVGKFYLNGGPGYTFSRKALKAYVEQLMETCEYIDGPQEDLYLSRCLWSNNYTTKNAFIDTRDEVGAYRYHALDISVHSGWPSNYNKTDTTGFAILIYMKRVMPQSSQFLEEQYGFPPVVEDDYVSKSSIVFHRHTPMQMRRMEMLLYKNKDEECSIFSQNINDNINDNF